jgi:8-oxo-dGTP pyrophosphatase MutT (NUDIX family)
MTDVDSDRIARLNEFVHRMNAVDRDLSFTVVRPKDAATLILVDRSGPAPKVLLGKRHARHRFMPGKYVFPGGGVDPTDKHMSAATPLHPHAEMRLMQRFHKGSPARARALALAAVRETFEETGLLLGTRAEAANAPEGPWSAFAQHKCCPICAISTSSAARSRRRDGRAGSTPASSPWMQARSRTGSRG